MIPLGLRKDLADRNRCWADWELRDHVQAALGVTFGESHVWIVLDKGPIPLYYLDDEGVESLTVLVPALTDRPWFHEQVVPRLEAVAFLRARLRRAGFSRPGRMPYLLIHVAKGVEFPVDSRALCSLTGEGAEDVALLADESTVVIFDSRLAKKVANGEEFCATLRNKLGTRSS